MTSIIPAVLEIIARIAFVATADLLSRTGAGFNNIGIGGQKDPVDWLQQYGLSDSLIWFHPRDRDRRPVEKGNRSEESTTGAYIEMEWAAEMQADIERGK
jgi:hypothetical protein